jgi:hypothetical protein
MALVRLAGLAATRVLTVPPQPSRLANMFLRQQPAAGHHGSAGRLGPRHLRDGPRRERKLSVGFEDPKRDVIVSLSACDLYNARATPIRRRWRRGDQRPKHFLPAPTRSRRARS